MNFLGLELTIELLAVFALIGAFTGTLTGLTGASGMSLLISALLLVNVDIRNIIGLTFVVTVANAAASIGPYWRSRNIDFRVALISALAIAVTVPVGHLFSGKVDNSWLKILMTVALMIIGLKMLLPSGKSEEHSSDARINVWFLIPFGLVTGCIMGVTGGGGGVLIATFLIIVMAMPTKVAIGSSILIMGISAIPGVVLHTIDGTATWGVALIVMTTSALAAFFSARFSNQVSGYHVKRILGGYLVVSSVVVLLLSIFGAGEPLLKEKKMNSSENPRCIMVVTTSDDPAVLKSVSRAAVEKKLAACAQVLGPIESHYVWKDQVETSTEWQCQLKTTMTKFGDLKAVIQAQHNYEMPEIIAVDIVDGSEDYLNWVVSQTS